MPGPVANHEASVIASTGRLTTPAVPNSAPMLPVAVHPRSSSAFAASVYTAYEAPAPTDASRPSGSADAPPASAPADPVDAARMTTPAVAIAVASPHR